MDTEKTWPSAGTGLKGALLAACVFGLVACGKNVDIKTPPGFVELRNQEPAYHFRATTPEGVVVAARRIEAKDRTDLDFWERAIAMRVRDNLGYALLEVREVVAGRKKGKQLRFGRDENGKSYLYWVTIFAGTDVLFLLEAGGPEERMKANEEQILWHVGTLKVE